jgi:ABC-2 type transport system permease protein
MNKISVIIKREYITRVRKKSFIIMTVLAPILMAALIILPTVLMMNQDADFKKIAVIEDGADLFKGVLKNTKEAEFVYLENTKVDDLKGSFEKAGYYGILYISPEVINTPNAIQLISKQQPPIGLLQHIENSLEKEIERQKLMAYKIENLDEIMKNVKTNVSVQTIKINESGVVKKTSTGIAMALAYIFGLLMYMLVFLFGSQVMRGVIEEKTSRVVEVIISSVKPVQLMMGENCWHFPGWSYTISYLGCTWHGNRYSSSDYYSEKNRYERNGANSSAELNVGRSAGNHDKTSCRHFS